MAGQKKQTKLEIIKFLNKFKDNDIILIDTRKDEWIRKVGSVTPLEVHKEESAKSATPTFNELERRAIAFAWNKCTKENKDFLSLNTKEEIIHSFIGCTLNIVLLKNGKGYADTELVKLYNKFKKQM